MPKPETPIVMTDVSYAGPHGAITIAITASVQFGDPREFVERTILTGLSQEERRHEKT